MDNFWTILNLIKIIKVNDFKEWMMEYHHIKENRLSKHFFKGFHSTIMNLLRTLIDAFLDENPFKFQTSTASNSLNRSKDISGPLDIMKPNIGQPIYIEDIDNDDEMIQILRIFDEIFKAAYKSQDFYSLDTKFELCKKHLSIFYKIFEENIEVNDITLIDKDSYIQFAFKKFLNNHFHVIPNGIPSFLKSKVKKINVGYQYLEIIFPGFKYTLQYLWFLVLNKKLKDDTLLNLHRIEKINKNERLDSIIKIGIKRYNPKNYKKIFQIHKKWLAIDKTFNLIYSKFIKPEYDKYEIKNHYEFNLHKHLVLRTDSTNTGKTFQEEIKIHLKKIKNYVSTDNGVKKITNIEELKRSLYFRPVTLLHFNYQRNFEGIMSFRIMLRGLVYYYQENSDETLLIKRIKHTNPHNENSIFSYGISIYEEGWYIFLELVSEKDSVYIEDLLIEKLKSLINVKVETIQVSYELLINTYLPYYDVEYRLKNQVKQFISNFKGNFLELLSYYLNSIKKYDVIYWSKKINNTISKQKKEFDIIIKEKKGKTKFIEVKTTLNKEDIKDIIEKKNFLDETCTLSSKFFKSLSIKCTKDYKFETWIWNRHPQKQFERQLKEHKIKIISIKELLNNSSLNSEKRNKCKDLMDFNIN